jgi:hypothetical protein
MRHGRVRVIIPALGRELSPGRLEITIEDVSSLDVPSRIVATVSLRVDAFETAEPTEIEVDCPLPDRSATGRLEASARLLVHDDDALRAGDLNTVVATPFRLEGLSTLQLVEVPPA